MSQASFLLEYQQCDEIISKYNRIKKQSKTHAELLVVQEAITAEQNKIKQYDEEINKISKDVDTLCANYDAVTENLKGEIAKIQGGSTTEAQIQKMAQNANAMKAELTRIHDSIVALRAKLADIMSIVEASSEVIKKQKGIHIELKKQYDAEIGDYAEKSKAAKERREVLEQQIKPENLNLYKEVRNVKGVNATVIVKDGVCGCGMKVPQAQLTKLADGVLSVCDSCGKILCTED